MEIDEIPHHPASAYRSDVARSDGWRRWPHAASPLGQPMSFNPDEAARRQILRSTSFEGQAQFNRCGHDLSDESIRRVASIFRRNLQLVGFSFITGRVGELARINL
jgi:hypothetical protein